MLKGKDILIVGQQPWDVEIGSNCKDIAIELSKFNRILYVNSPLDRITRIRAHTDSKVQKRMNIIKGKESGLTKIKENLWVFFPDVLIESINWIRIGFLFALFNKFNNRKFAKSLQRPISSLQFKDYILFNDSDIFRSFHLKELLKPALYVYYLRDFMIATTYWKRHGRRYEPLLIKKSDLVISNSPYLREYSNQFNRKSFCVGQGFDLELVKSTDFNIVPEDIKSIDRPLIGYVGALTSSRLNISLIYKIAVEKPNWSVVLVGPEDRDFRKSKLHNLENVYFLGPKKPETLFQYINAFDVCINPQLVNDLTKGNYPRKIDEYLAVGKPVVAVETETMLAFKDFVYLAKEKEKFIAMIEFVLRSEDFSLRERRIEFAYTHSWANSVNNMGTIIDKYHLNSLSI